MDNNTKIEYAVKGVRSEIDLAIQDLDYHVYRSEQSEKARSDLLDDLKSLDRLIKDYQVLLAERDKEQRGE